MTYFTARSNLVPYAFIWEKLKTMDFSETTVVYDIKVGRCSQVNKYMKLWVPKVRFVLWPCSKSLRFNIFKLHFLNNHWFLTNPQHSGERYRTSGALVCFPPKVCSRSVCTWCYTALCKVVQLQQYDTNPTLVREKSHADISCKQMHSVHILPYWSGLSKRYDWNSIQGYWKYHPICLISLKNLTIPRTQWSE